MCFINWMTHESLVNEDWQSVVARLGGAKALNESARETKAFLRPREIKDAVDLLTHDQSPRLQQQDTQPLP